MATRELKELPVFILEELAKFQKEPGYMTATQFTLFKDNGVEVSICLQRDKADFVGTTPIFKKPKL